MKTKVITTIEQDKQYKKLKPEKIIEWLQVLQREILRLFQTMIYQELYGAGAVQTLMNEYGVKPERRLNVLMVGAGNIGLIVRIISLSNLE